MTEQEKTLDMAYREYRKRGDKLLSHKVPTFSTITDLHDFIRAEQAMMTILISEILRREDGE